MIPLNNIIKETSKYKKTHSATFYKDKNDIYKVIERNCLLYKDIISHIKYNNSIHNEVNNKIILPEELIIDSNYDIRGYKCPFIKGINLEKLAKDLDTKEKIIILNKLTDLLKEINNYLVVGDVNLSNCMYDKNLDSYLIDFDLSTKLDEEPCRMALYNFFKKSTKKEILSNPSTDKLKMAIICASVLYNNDFEASFVSLLPYTKWNEFYQYTENTFIKDYFKSAFKLLNKGEEIPDYLYLPNTNSFSELIDQDYKNIRKLAKKCK